MDEMYDPFQDQVECARYRAERDALAQTVQAVCERMEAHFLGIEGMDESPVASWARDLRAALGSLHAPKVYDADGAEIREGDRVWSTQLDEPHEWIVIDPHEDRGDSQTVLVSIGDRTGHARPEDLTHRAPVLAADGEPLEVGQTVYVIANGKTHHVTEIDTVSKRFRSMEQVDGSHWLDPMCFTHQRPVLDADGVPIREGDTVYGIGRTQHVFVVLGQPGLGGGNGRFKIACHDVTDGVDCHCDPSLLTHTKPERDSWERVEKDTEKSFSEYWGCEEIECSRCPALIDGKTPHEFFGCSHNCTIAMKRDIVRRCKALAERAWFHGDE